MSTKEGLHRSDILGKLLLFVYKMKIRRQNNISKHAQYSPLPFISIALP